MSDVKTTTTNARRGQWWGVPHVDAAGVVCFAAVTAIAWLLGVRPVLANRAQARAEQEQYVDAHQKLADVDRDLAALTLQLESVSRDRAARAVPLQPAAQLNRRLSLVTDLASRAGTGLDDVQPARPIPGARYQLVPIRLAGTGPYAGLAALLHELRTNCPDVGIGAFTVNGSPAATDQPATFTVELTWYAQRSTESRPAPAAGGGK